MVARDAAVILAAQALKDDPSFGLMNAQEQTEEAWTALLRAGLTEPTPELVAEVLQTRDSVEKSPRSPIRQRAHIPMGTKLVGADDSPPVAAGQNATAIVNEALARASAPPRLFAQVPPRRASERVSTAFLQRVADFTGLLDPTLAGLLKLPRSTVQAMRTQRTPEYLEPQQIEALLNAVRTTRAQLDALDAEMTFHLMSS